jgi:hypothetical protein
MADMKTKPTKKSVEEFLNEIEDPKRKEDCYTLLGLMKEATREEPKMWGENMVGFGTYHYKYESGREGDYFLTGFSPRKSNLTLYMLSGFRGYEDLLAKLGKHKSSQSCLYLKSLKDIDLGVLLELIIKTSREISTRYK